MNIVLINPAILIHKEHRNKDASFPLGLGYLAAVAMQKGHRVHIIDTLLEGFDRSRPFDATFNEWGLSDEQLIARIRPLAPDIIGIACTFTSRWPLVRRVGAALKKTFPGTPLIAGGIHPSNAPEEVLGDPDIDFIAIGEAEDSFARFLDALKEGNGGYADIPGFGFKKNGAMHINRDCRFIENLDNIPFPARDLVPYEKYFQFNRNSVIATRGCPYSCAFCSMQAVMGRTFRTRTAKNFVDEIEAVHTTYRATFFSFDDDNLTLREKFVFDFCDEIIRRGIKINWNVPNGVNINSLTFESLSRMKEAGCYSVCLAIESADPRVLEIMHKEVSLHKAEDVLRWCRQLHIFTLGFFLIGMPGEDLQSMERTREFALHLPLDALNVSIVTPFPGTALFNDCVKKGYIKEYAAARFNIHESNITTETLSAEAVKSFQEKFLDDFERAKTPPFTHEVLKKAVRNPGTVEFLEDLRHRYFRRAL